MDAERLRPGALRLAIAALVVADLVRLLVESLLLSDAAYLGPPVGWPGALAGERRAAPGDLTLLVVGPCLHIGPMERTNQPNRFALGRGWRRACDRHVPVVQAAKSESDEHVIVAGRADDRVDGRVTPPAQERVDSMHGAIAPGDEQRSGDPLPRLD